MSINRQVIPVAGLAATAAMAIYMVVHLNAQTQVTGDFTNAAIAEVRDAQGAVVLRGQFAADEDDDGEIERRAALQPAGADADASGEAEIEFNKTSPATQEIEFSAKNLEPKMAYTFAIDGVEVATATANARGRVEVEVDITLR